MTASPQPRDADHSDTSTPQDRATNHPPDPVLSVRDLRVRFDDGEQITWALNGVSLEVARGEILGVVGESGSGKTVTGKAIMGILPEPPAEIVSGELLFDGMRLLDLDRRERRKLNGTRLAMIFQDALASLDPRFKIGFQIGELLRSRGGMSRRDARKRTVELLDKVRIPNPAQRANDYPHQFSGGMRQRAMIAIAIALEPDVLIADEPTTALDVTIQAEVMDLLAELQNDLGMSMVLITHDLALASEYCDRINVMYAGRIVESAASQDLFRVQYHPYSAGLVRSTPTMESESQDLSAIPGVPPTLRRPPTDCPFAPRCELAIPRCHEERPPNEVTASGRTAACFRSQVAAEELSLEVSG